MVKGLDNEAMKCFTNMDVNWNMTGYHIYLNIACFNSADNKVDPL